MGKVIFSITFELLRMAGFTTDGSLGNPPVCVPFRQFFHRCHGGGTLI